MGAGIIYVFVGVIIIFWLAMAIPTSLIARQVGHPKWISYVAWCPFLLALIVIGVGREFPQIATIVGVANFFFWLPGSIYLLALALKLEKLSNRRQELRNSNLRHYRHFAWGERAKPPGDTFARPPIDDHSDFSGVYPGVQQRCTSVQSKGLPHEGGGQ